MARLRRWFGRLALLIVLVPLLVVGVVLAALQVPAVQRLLAETIRVAVKTRAVSQRRLERITVDTTVQTKAVAHPTDSHLIVRAIEWLNRIARRHGVTLRQSFLRLATQARREASRLMYTRGHKQGLRWVRRLRTWLGRLIRDIRRKIAGNAELEAAFRKALERAEKILNQQPGDKNKLYAMHAPEVECIGKGKARTRYGFCCYALPFGWRQGFHRHHQ